ncbi:MAG: ZIP family metal transporter [Actinomycetota bacterium]|nr:ZIP family metal transporter [Actinomycetota bacterium]
MSTGQTVLLGAIAGFTIFLGLPMGRIQTESRRVKTFLAGVSAGILVFLFFDIMKNATGPLEDAVNGRAWGRLTGIGLVFAAGLGIGLLGLLYVSRLWRRRSIPASLGPGAMAVAEAPDRTREALHVGMSIAIGIGLHNFSEGLAIGQAAHSGEVSLAVLLVIGFGLHNATEGFGIVGPLAAADVRATWGWLVLAGIIGGGPTFLGTLVGTSVSSTYVFVAFLALAAGAILYVVGELFNAGRRMSWEVTLWGVLAGFLVGLATELVVVAAGV